MPFTYTNERGSRVSVEADSHAIMDAYLLEGISWAGMRERFGLGGRRMYRIRMSPEWAVDVDAYARRSGRDAASLRRRLCYRSESISFGFGAYQWAGGYE